MSSARFGFVGGDCGGEGWLAWLYRQENARRDQEQWCGRKSRKKTGWLSRSWLGQESMLGSQLVWSEGPEENRVSFSPLAGQDPTHGGERVWSEGLAGSLLSFLLLAGPRLYARWQTGVARRAGRVPIVLRAPGWSKSLCLAAEWCDTTSQGGGLCARRGEVGSRRKCPVLVPVVFGNRNPAGTGSHGSMHNAIARQAASSALEVPELGAELWRWRAARP